MVSYCSHTSIYKRFFEPMFSALGIQEVPRRRGLTKVLVFSHGDDNEIRDFPKGLCFRIYVNGEPHGTGRDCDLAFECKHTDNAIYLPFYVLHFAERTTNSFQDLWQPLPLETERRPKFCAFMYSNPVPYRNEIFTFFNDAASRVGKRVDALGPCMHNVNEPDDRRLYNLGTRTFYDSAVDRYKDYRFVLAIENTPLAGYCTEKLINPLLAGAVPIYFGDPSLSEQPEFNHQRIIYMQDFPTIRACAEFVLLLDENPAMYAAYRRGAVFTTATTEGTKFNLNLYVDQLSQRLPTGV